MNLVSRRPVKVEPLDMENQTLGELGQGDTTGGTHLNTGGVHVRKKERLTRLIIHILEHTMIQSARHSGATGR